MNSNEPGIVTDESPAAFLQRVRAQTCYSALRGFLRFGLLSTILMIVISAGISIVTANATTYYYYGSSYSNLQVILTIGAAIIGIIVAIAIWQWFVMFVDKADTLIEQTRKKHKDE